MDLQCYVPDTRSLAPLGSGSLDGISVAIKDLFSIENHVSSFGHPRWRETHEPATEHSVVVTQLLSDGATIAGVTKLDQMAYSLIGNVGEGPPPVNPYDPDCYCGGSSSGTASAVAGELAKLGVGTDTAGSIRIPAAACGLLGLRPTHGAIDTSGVIPLAPSFDVVGLMAKDSRLLCRAYQVLAKQEDMPRKFTRVVSPETLDSPYTESLASLTDFAKTLAKTIDAEHVVANLNNLIDAETGQLFMHLQSREIWKTHADWIQDNISFLAPDVQVRLEKCRLLSTTASETEKQQDLEARTIYRQQLLRFMRKESLIVLPVLPERGPMRHWTDDRLVEYRTQCFRLTAPSSLAGVPQAVLHHTATFSDEVRVPVTLLGPPNSDLALLDVLTLCE